MVCCQDIIFRQILPIYKIEAAENEPDVVIWFAKGAGSMVDSIAAMSMNMSAAKLQQDVGIGMMKKVMDVQETQEAALMKMLDAAGSSIPAGDIGQILDVTG